MCVCGCGCVWVCVCGGVCVCVCVCVCVEGERQAVQAIHGKVSMQVGRMFLNEKTNCIWIQVDSCFL